MNTQNRGNFKTGKKKLKNHLWIGMYEQFYNIITKFIYTENQFSTLHNNNDTIINWLRVVVVGTL